MLGGRTSFLNREGQRLAAILDRPAARPKAYALFAHCFTCGKSLPAARSIAERLVAHGIAVLRFDFAGIGESEGEFAETNFSSNVDDIERAADYLRHAAEAPTLLIGHSLGGAAILAAAARIPEAKAVATIGAPCDPAHVVNLFDEHIEAIEETGEVAVSLAGREFTITRQFLDDVTEQRLAPQIRNLDKALLVMHAPTDQIVGIENAARIYEHAKHPKSFVSLDGANHLLRRKSDAAFAADMLAVWAQRHVAGDDEAPGDDRLVVVAETGAGKFQQSLALGRHHLLADEPLSVGGRDSGPTPYELLLAGLGACTSMTLRMYAERKEIPLGRVTVTLQHRRRHSEDTAEVCEGKPTLLERIERKITLEGELNAEQRAKLLEIAEKCPVHRTLTGHVEICTSEEESLVKA